MKGKDTITYNELMSEIDRFRIDSYCKEIEILPEQRDFITKCHESNRKVPYDVMAKMWEKLGWGKSSEASIRRRCKIVFEGDI